MECLNKVIKLSRTECECFEDNLPEDYNEGKSDIYLDELEGLNLSLVGASANCEAGNIWEIMSRARENATTQFKADLLSCIQANHVSKRRNYSGIVGSIKYSQALVYTENTAGAKFKPQQIQGGYMTVNKIGLLFNAVATFNISVYSNEDMDTPIAVYPVTTVANGLQYATISTPLKLKMWSNVVDRIEYYFVYDLIGTYYPLNNKNCGGCGQTDSNRPYASWVTAKGMKGNTPTALDEFTETTELNGLVLDASFKCDSTGIICSDEYPLDFETDGRAQQIAFTIRFKAGELLLETILASDNINRYTMLDRETLWGKRNRYRKLYEDWMSYLCDNTEILNNDCLGCKQNNNVIKGGILA